MSVINDFVPFATGGGANVESQAAYLADPALSLGQQPGIASSAFNNKMGRQANFVGSQIAQFIANSTQTNTIDNGVAAQFLSQLMATFSFLAPTVSSLTSGSGNWNASYYFFIASGNATAGATYTNNAVTYTVVSTITAGTLLQAAGNGTPLTSGTLTKTSGTGDATLVFYAVRAPSYLRVRLIAGGGGGGGSGPTSGTLGMQGGTGGNTTFGTALLTANGGTGGSNNQTSTAGGIGGTASLGTGPIGIAQQGSYGAAGYANPANGAQGGGGGCSPLGGAGGGLAASVGSAAITNSGSGGAGASASTGSLQTGNGGGSGGFIDALIFSPLSTYAYVIGAAGTGGTAGTGGIAGGAGGSGLIIVEAHYQ